MGTRIVNLMLDAGHHLTLWARRPASLEPFVGRVDVAATPRQVALASDMVGICVWDEGDVEQVLVRDDGVLSGARPESVISIHSTISPASCLRFQDAAAAVGAQLIDATVSVGSNLPKLLVMVGGERVRSGQMPRCPRSRRGSSASPGTAWKWPDGETRQQHHGRRYHRPR